MPVVAGNYQDTTADVFDLVRSHLNDADDGSFGTPSTFTPAWVTNTLLLPFLNSAYRRMQKDLAARGISILRDTYINTLKAGGTKISDDGGDLDLVLPTDFVHPWIVKARPDGSSVMRKEIERKFMELSQKNPDAMLDQWIYMSDEIRFIGATADIEVELVYEKRLPKLTDGDSLRLRDAVDAIAALTASRVARSRGVLALAADMRAQYEEELQLWVSGHFRPIQRTPARRRGYGARRRVLFQ